MSEIESIIGGIIFLAITTIVITVSFLGFTKYQEMSYSVDLAKIEYENNLNKFETLLSSTDIYSKRNIYETIAVAILRNQTYSSIYGDVELNHSIKKQFDYFFGENNYYLEIKPHIVEIKISFLYDEGEQIKAINKKENFTKIIVDTKEEFQDIGVNVTFEVYVLNKNSSDVCDQYSLNGIKCDEIAIDDLYDSSYTNNFSLIDPIKNSNLVPEKLNEYQTYVYSLNDYATFLGQVSKVNAPDKKSYSHKNIMLFFTDVMNFGGANDSFFVTTMNYFMSDNYDTCESSYNNCISPAVSTVNSCVVDCANVHSTNQAAYESCYDLCIVAMNDDIAELGCLDLFNNCAQGVANERRVLSNGYYYYNYYCVINDDFNRSDSRVKEILPILRENGNYVYPILIRNNNITETPSERSDMKTYFSKEGWSLGVEENNGDSETICGKTICPGCFENETHAIFHKETRENHLKQLKLITNATDGSLLDYDSNPDLKFILSEVINDILEKDIFYIGKQKKDSSAYIYNKKQTIDTDKGVGTFDFNFEVYSSEYKFNNTLGFVPIINEYSKFDGNFYIVISHNKPILNFTMEDFVPISMNILEEIKDLKYKYEIEFDFIPDDFESKILTYEDATGRYNITLELGEIKTIRKDIAVYDMDGNKQYVYLWKGNGTHAGIYDLLIIFEGLDKKQAEIYLEESLGSGQYSLFRTRPFMGKEHLFNFYYYLLPEVVHPEIECDSTDLAQSTSLNGIEQFDHIFSQLEDFLDGKAYITQDPTIWPHASRGLDYLKMSLNCKNYGEYTPYSQTFVHEFSHMFGKLLDEYVTTTGYTIDIDSNCASSVADKNSRWRTIADYDYREYYSGCYYSSAIRGTANSIMNRQWHYGSSEWYDAYGPINTHYLNLKIEEIEGSS